MSRSAVPASRIARRRAQRRGRPRGSLPLLQDPHRFETAAWVFATAGLGLGPANAAAAVAGAFSTKPITAETIGDLVLRLSAGVDHATIKGRADRIRRRADAALRLRTDDDERWLCESAAALLMLVTSERNTGAAVLALADLRTLGWTEPLRRLADRLQAGLASNLPPADDPISPRVRALIETMCSNSKAASEG